MFASYACRVALNLSLTYIVASIPRECGRELGILFSCMPTNKARLAKIASLKDCKIVYTFAENAGMVAILPIAKSR